MVNILYGPCTGVFFHQPPFRLATSRRRTSKRISPHEILIELSNLLGRLLQVITVRFRTDQIISIVFMPVGSKVEGTWWESFKKAAREDT